MQIATLSNVISPALRVPDMRGTAVKSSVKENKVRSLYERLHRPTSSRTRLSPATPAVARKPTRSLATTSSWTRPSATTSVVAAKRKQTLASNALRTHPGAVGKAASRKTVIVARARADYRQSRDGTMKQTRIPGPTTKAMMEAKVRSQSTSWIRMASVAIRRPIVTPMVEITEEVTEVDTEIIGWKEPAVEEEEGTMVHEADDISLMFNDDSFDEAVSPTLQTDSVKLCGRTMVSMRRLGLNMVGLIKAPWFDGLARCPTYVGDDIGIQRVRPRKVVEVETVKVPEEESEVAQDEEEDVPAAATSDAPKAVSPAVTTRKPAPVPAVKTTTGVGSTTKRQARKTGAASTSRIGCKTNELKASKPSVPKTSSRKIPAKVATPRSKAITKPQPSKTKTVAAPTLKGGQSNMVKAIVTCPAPVAEGTLKSALRQPGSKTNKKRTQFLDGSIKTRFYSQDNPVSQSVVDATNSELELEWEPLQGLLHSYPSSQGHGTRQLFEFNDLGKFTLKRRFLQRYVSVKAYEARRRLDILSLGEEPGLGQLEYGNEDFKIALQASKMIESHDIGILQDLSAIGKAGKLFGNRRQMAMPVVVFGSFHEPFEPTVIPDKAVKAYKKPVRWPTARFWERFAEKNFRRLAEADMED